MKLAGAVKLKWKYDKKSKQWLVGESVAWANDGMYINKENGRYELCPRAGIHFIFNKLILAKIVAQLIKHG
jgi:hypothetical protein